MKKYGVDQAAVTVVGYYFCDEPIPYRTTIVGKNVTLGQFKQHIAKKGNYRSVLSTLLFAFTVLCVSLSQVFTVWCCLNIVAILSHLSLSVCL